MGPFCRARIRDCHSFQHPRFVPGADMYRGLNNSFGSAPGMNLFNSGALPLLMLLAAMLLLGVSACNQRRSTNPTAGDPQRGALLISREGCGGCHSIPGIGNADGLVGPPL